MSADYMRCSAEQCQLVGASMGLQKACPSTPPSQDHQNSRQRGGRTLIACLDRVGEVSAVELRAERGEEPLQTVCDGQRLLGGGSLLAGRPAGLRCSRLRCAWLRCRLRSWPRWHDVWCDERSTMLPMMRETQTQTSTWRCCGGWALKQEYVAPS